MLKVHCFTDKMLIELRDVQARTVRAGDAELTGVQARQVEQVDYSELRGLHDRNERVDGDSDVNQAEAPIYVNVPVPNAAPQSSKAPPSMRASEQPRSSEPPNGSGDRLYLEIIP